MDKSVDSFIDHFGKSSCRFDFDDALIIEEQITDDGEQVDQDTGKHGRQNDRPAVSGYRSNHIVQRFFSVNQVHEQDTVAVRTVAEANETDHQHRTVVQ